MIRVDDSLNSALIEEVASFVLNWGRPRASQLPGANNLGRIRTPVFHSMAYYPPFRKLSRKADNHRYGQGRFYTVAPIKAIVDTSSRDAERFASLGQKLINSAS